jgi:hypothetical protein
MFILEILWDLAYLFFFFGYLVTPFWDLGVVLWFSCFAGRGKENAPYAFWYDNEVRPLMYEDERMRELSDLAHARLRSQAIQRARMVAEEPIIIHFTTSYFIEEKFRLGADEGVIIHIRGIAEVPI